MAVSARIFALLFALLGLGVSGASGSELLCETVARKDVFLSKQGKFYRFGPSYSGQYHQTMEVSVVQVDSPLEKPGGPSPWHRVIRFGDRRTDYCSEVAQRGGGGKTLQCAPNSAGAFQMIVAGHRSQYTDDGKPWTDGVITFKTVGGSDLQSLNTLSLDLKGGDRSNYQLCNDLGFIPPPAPPTPAPRPSVPCQHVRPYDIYLYNQRQWRAFGTGAIRETDEAVFMPLVTIQSPLDDEDPVDSRQIVIYLTGKQVRTCRIYRDRLHQKALRCTNIGAPRMQFVYNGEKYQYVHDGKEWDSAQTVQMKFTEVQRDYPIDAHVVRVELVSVSYGNRVTTIGRDYRVCTDLENAPQNTGLSQPVAQTTRDPRLNCVQLDNTGIFFLENDWKQMRTFTKSDSGIEVLLSTVYSPIEHPEILGGTNRVIRFVDPRVQLCQVSDGHLSCIDVHIPRVQLVYDGVNYQHVPAGSSWPVGQDVRLQFQKVTGDFPAEPHVLRLEIENSRNSAGHNIRTRRICTDLRFLEELLAATCPPAAACPDKCPPPPPPPPTCHPPCSHEFRCEDINQTDFIFHNAVQNQWRTVAQSDFIRSADTFFLPVESRGSPLDGPVNPRLRIFKMTYGKVELCRVGYDALGKKGLHCIEDAAPRIQLVHNGDKYQRFSTANGWNEPQDEQLLTFLKVNGDFPHESNVIRVQIHSSGVRKTDTRAYKLCTNLCFDLPALAPPPPPPPPCTPSPPCTLPPATAARVPAHQKQGQPNDDALDPDGPVDAQQPEQPKLAASASQRQQQADQGIGGDAPGGQGRTVFVLVAVLAGAMLLLALFCFYMLVRALAHATDEVCDAMPLSGFCRRLRRLGARHKGSPVPLHDTALSDVRPFVPPQQHQQQHQQHQHHQQQHHHQHHHQQQ